MLKDDKTYPFLKITNEKYPRLVITRKVLKDKALYFGPYPMSVRRMRQRRSSIDYFLWENANLVDEGALSLLSFGTMSVSLLFRRRSESLYENRWWSEKLFKRRTRKNRVRDPSENEKAAENMELKKLQNTETRSVPLRQSWLAKKWQILIYWMRCIWLCDW